MLRGCHGDSVNHPQSVYQMNTGSILMGRPSLGSWVSYGLGTENDSLPAFVVLPDPGGGIKGGPAAWGNGYLPATYQGTTFRGGATPIVDLRPQKSISGPATARHARVAADVEPPAQRLARRRQPARSADRSLRAGVSHAVGRAGRGRSRRRDAPKRWRCTASAKKTTDEFGRRCLLARRLVERGVRFVQLYSGDTERLGRAQRRRRRTTACIAGGPTSRSRACCAICAAAACSTTRW